MVKEIEARGGRASVRIADVTDEQAVNAMARSAFDTYGRIDILVNNAAVRDVRTIDEIDFAAWKRITGIILDGAFLTTKACLASLRASGAGAIVNIGGMSGHTGIAGRPHVIAAKSVCSAKAISARSCPGLVMFRKSWHWIAVLS